MGLSANDYTTDEKNKLEGIATGAEVNIQPDWNETNRKSSAFIKNKPKSMPASDVYDWAKSPLKPSYDRSEVGLGNVPNVTTNDQVPTFEQAEERDNIKSGEKLSVILGKMMKWFADFSATAFDGIATKWRTARNINGMSVDGSENRANYGICSTASATVAKTVSCVGYGLVTGAEITVRFTVTNTAANPTLNVNSTGAKPIYYRGTAITAGYLAANRTYAFRYNGTQYELVGDIDTNATYNNMSAASASAEGKAGLVPAPSAGKQNAYFRGDGSWVTPTNNLLATEPGTPLDAVMGKELKENLEALNSKLGKAGKIISSSIVQTTAARGVETIIGEITLDSGVWIILMNVWNPLGMATALLGVRETGHSTLATWQLMQNLSFATHKSKTTYHVLYTQWSEETVTVVNGEIYAIQIA